MYSFKSIYDRKLLQKLCFKTFYQSQGHSVKSGEGCILRQGTDKGL